MAETSSTGRQAAVTVLTCVFCRISFTGYHELRCHIISTHKYMRIPSPAAPNSITGGPVDSSSASAATIEDEILPKSPKINKRKQMDQESASKDGFCESCQKYYFSDRGLRVHQRSVHKRRSHSPPIPRAAVCEICEIEFPSLEDLQSHRVLQSPIEISPPTVPSTVVIPAPPPPPAASPAAAAAAGDAGMGYSESGSQVVELRKSSRLLAKCSTTTSQSTEMAPSSKRPKPKRLHPYQRGDFFVMGGPSAIPKFLQRQRKSTGIYFQCAYAHEDAHLDGWDKIIEKKFIVVSGGEKIHQQHVLPYDVEGCHGITWIGVHGINSICAVYKNDKPDRQCIVDWLKNKPLSSYFTDYVLSEMEDVADSPPYLEKILKEPTVDSSHSQKTLKPFAVVSLPDTSNADEKDCPKVLTPSLKAQGEAISYLKNKLTGHSAYSMLQIQQIAIYAFQLLWEMDFKAEEITVGCFYEEGGGCDYKLGNLSCAKVNRCLETINQSVENEIEDQV